MSILNRYRVWWGAALVLVAASVTLIAACRSGVPGGDVGDQGEGNGDDNQDSDGGDGGGQAGGERGPAASNIANPGAVEGLFAANEHWTLATSDDDGILGVLAVGVGDVVEFIANFPNSACFAINPQSTVSYDGQTFTFSTDYSTRLTGEQCRLSVTAPAQACEPSPTRPNTGCELPDGQYAMIDTGRTLPVSTAAFAFPAACDTLPVFLEPFGDWAITSIHPLALPFAGVAGDVGEVFVAIGGNGGRVVEAGLCIGATVDDCPGCFGVPVQGQVRLNGSELMVSITFSQDENSCGILFTGDIASCAVFAEPGVEGQPVVRVIGEGTYTLNGETGPIEVLYFSGDPDGNIRR